MFKRQIIKILFFLYCSTFTCSCSHKHEEDRLKEGDILFQDLDCGELTNLKKEIPEGKLGTNPGLISRSNKIDIIKINHLIQ